MCKELDDELARGNSFSESLVEHVISMGAGNATIPVEDHDGNNWTVTVERVGKEVVHV